MCIFIVVSIVRLRTLSLNGQFYAPQCVPRVDIEMDGCLAAMIDIGVRLLTSHSVF
jgi:hypothetical protein